MYVGTASDSQPGWQAYLACRSRLHSGLLHASKAGIQSTQCMLQCVKRLARGTQHLWPSASQPVPQHHWAHFFWGSKCYT